MEVPITECKKHKKQRENGFPRPDGVSRYIWCPHKAHSLVEHIGDAIVSAEEKYVVLHWFDGPSDSQSLVVIQ